MRITDLRVKRTPRLARASARVTWECAERPPFELWFETDGQAAEELVPSPEAFVTACALHARRHGERQVVVEGSLCPKLAQGLTAATALLRTWFGGSRKPIAIEATKGFKALRPQTPPRAAVFLTGGVDSTHLIHANRTDYPSDHPAWFAEGISLQGHLVSDHEDSPWYARARAHMEKMAEAKGMTLTAVRTNLWDLDPDLGYITRQSLSSALAAAAHLFPGRWSRASIASGLHVAAEYPRGTHPMLDSLYGSSGVEIRHDPLPLTRFDRLRVLTENGGDAIDELLVCMAYPGAPHLNCGECEKCLRTMTGLVALGRLADARTFRHRDVSPAMIRPMPMAAHDILFWKELLEPLDKRGRIDLVRAIEAKTEEARRLDHWARDAGWKGQLRKIDRRVLGGRLQELRRRLQ